MLYAICVLGGLVIGAIITWLIVSNKDSDAKKQANIAEGTIGELRTQIQVANDDFNKLRDTLKNEQEAKVKAETQLKEATHHFDEERKILDEAKTKFTDTFKALAGDTLDNTNQSFLKLAKETFEKILTDAKGDLGKRQVAIDGLVEPLAKSLENFEEHIRDLEINRKGAYTSLEEQVKKLSTAQQQLQKETGNLVTALRTPQVRGRWGEMTLKRVTELAGMSEHCDFTEQVSKETETGTIRPDLIVHLSSEREIVVDSKVSLDAYLNALSAETEEQRKQFLAQHSRQIRTHMNALAGKAYWEQFNTAPEFVVMFIPGESFFAAAVDCDHALLEDGMRKRVILATPTTLIALLHAVAHGWRQEQITKNARAISELGKQLYERMKVLTNHLAEIGKSLGKANTAYNKAVGSIETRVLPTARRFKELGAFSSSDIPIIEPMETTPREISAPDQSNETA